MSQERYKEQGENLTESIDIASFEEERAKALRTALMNRLIEKQAETGMIFCAVGGEGENRALILDSTPQASNQHLVVTMGNFYTLTFYDEMHPENPKEYLEDQMYLRSLMGEKKIRRAQEKIEPKPFSISKGNHLTLRIKGEGFFSDNVEVSSTGEKYTFFGPYGQLHWSAVLSVATGPEIESSLENLESMFSERAADARQQIKTLERFVPKKRSE